MDPANAAPVDWMSDSDAESCSTPKHFPALKYEDDASTAELSRAYGSKVRSNNMDMDTVDGLRQGGAGNSSTKCTVPSIAKRLATSVAAQVSPDEAVVVAECTSAQRQLSPWLGCYHEDRQDCWQGPPAEVRGRLLTIADACVNRPAPVLCEDVESSDGRRQEVQQWLEKQEARLQYRAMGNWPVSRVGQSLPPPAFVILGLLN